jgi:hypothetical protein
MPELTSWAEPKQAFAQATFTYPAHLAMLQGILPQARVLSPFYNRYAKQLWRIDNGRGGGSSLVQFPIGTRSIVAGFSRRGYMTIVLGAVDWFRHHDLNRDFEHAHFTGIHADRQMEMLLHRIQEDSRPFFGLLNLGETHYPYRFGGAAPIQSFSPARAAPPFDTGYGATQRNKQVAACRFLDARIGSLLQRLAAIREDTVIVVTADHGECFGEDGLYGHGFFHPCVMEVPLAIFALDRQPIS